MKHGEKSIPGSPTITSTAHQDTQHGELLTPSDNSTDLNQSKNGGEVEVGSDEVRPSQGVDGFPTGAALALINLSLCISVFLTALVRFQSNYSVTRMKFGPDS
jgi:hypothetical protein